MKRNENIEIIHAIKNNRRIDQNHGCADLKSFIFF